MAEPDIEIIDPRDPTDHGGYTHHSLGGEPVRIVLNDAGHQVDGDVLNAETGELERDVKVIQRVFRDDDCDDIDEDRFYELCAEKITEKKSELAAAGYVDDYGGADFEL